jgi:hypothetical protein
LPSQIAKLSDREGSFVQSYLQALSTHIYRSIKLPPLLQTFVDPIWDKLPVRPDVSGFPLPSRKALNYFVADESWMRRRAHTLAVALQGIRNVLGGKPLNGVIISERYTKDLPKVLPEALRQLVSVLDAFEKAILTSDGSRIKERRNQQTQRTASNKTRNRISR